MKRYTDAEKAEALALYATDGPTAVQREFGIPKGTVTKWAKGNGIETVAVQNTQAATIAIQVDHEARRAALAEKLLQIAEAGAAQELRLISESRLRDVVGSRTRAVHDLQLLRGEATARTEHTDARAEAQRMIDELAERRARRSA